MRDVAFPSEKNHKFQWTNIFALLYNVAHYINDATLIMRVFRGEKNALRTGRGHTGGWTWDEL